ncbi:MAG: MFS transporter [Methanomassiliicoccales archaeon]
MSPRWDPVRACTLNQTVHWSIIGLILPVMVLLQLEKGLNLLEVGMVIGVYSATIILFKLPTGGLSDSLGRKRVYLISLVMLFLSGTTVLLANDIVGMATGFFLFGLGRGLSSGTMDAWFVDEFDLAHPGGNLQEALARANRLIPLGIGTTSLLAGVIPMTLGRITEGILGLTVYSGNLILLNLVVVFQFLLTRRFVVEHLPTGGAAFSPASRDFPRCCPPP